MARLLAFKRKFIEIFVKKKAAQALLFYFSGRLYFLSQAVSHSREFCHASPEIISGYSVCFQQRRIK
jgi:hypothetical protein